MGEVLQRRSPSARLACKSAPHTFSHRSRSLQIYTALPSGRPARGIVNRVMREVGPMSDRVAAFPTAGSALAPLKLKAEAAGATDFSSLWSGQSASLGREIGSGDLTRQLAADAQLRLKMLSSN